LLITLFYGIAVTHQPSGLPRSKGVTTQPSASTRSQVRYRVNAQPSALPHKPSA